MTSSLETEQIEVWKGGQISQRFLVSLITIFLMGSLLLERYCFLVTVAKTQNFTYVTVLCVSILNCLFNLVMKLSQKKREPSRLHQLF